jgi:hypothetical protein
MKAEQIHGGYAFFIARMMALRQKRWPYAIIPSRRA